MTGDNRPTRDPGALWERLSSMRIEEPGAPRSFEAALAEANGWTLRHAAEVSAEYRRFLFLAATSQEPVTPSIAVDRAWHLHLTYTRHYWDTLCRQILGRPLHHEPGTGGASDEARFSHQYAGTLARYEEAFGAPAPANIWPRPQPVADAPLAGQPGPEKQAVGRCGGCGGGGGGGGPVGFDGGDAGCGAGCGGGCGG